MKLFVRFSYVIIVTFLGCNAPNNHQNASNYTTNTTNNDVTNFDESNVIIQTDSLSTTEFSYYDNLYKDSFDILLHQNGENLNYIDTLYTEMYIALKSLSPNSDNGQYAQLVIEKADKLISIDTIRENQIHYLDAKQIAQSIIKDKDGFIRTAFQQFNLYPENSFERLSSLGSLFLTINNKDSADYYLNRSLQVSKELLSSSNNEMIEKGIFGVLYSLVLLDKDFEAKYFIKEQLHNSHPVEIKESLNYYNQNFDEFKQYVIQQIYSFDFK